uniref:Terpenoid cylases/protein prenyltransferase alpha-alpha toroid; Terpenoid synthase; Late nodulin n=1 Tax=Medicago truncatula TaxID=3880 RepID=Q2HRX6_MEDTR|nr:Terpenoid cylases/protein prenyltransferase alpha-alpha toroid; Terpenoid synthase; Late nodulin [Medicago truncatula]
MAKTLKFVYVIVLFLSLFLVAKNIDGAKHCLRQTLHKNIPRLEAPSYISRYEQDPSHNENLLILAQLDFNMLQSLHQEEFGNFSNWWKELDVRSKLPYTRDMIVYYKPQYSMARKVMTKLFVIITVINDTYHAFGRIDELELFTKAIERWDISCSDNLPDYMKYLCDNLRAMMKH